MDMAMLESVVIRVDELKDEILFPSSRRCSTFSKLLTQLEMSYLFTPEFIGIVNHIQKHTGAFQKHTGALIFFRNLIPLQLPAYLLSVLSPWLGSVVVMASDL